MYRCMGCGRLNNLEQSGAGNPVCAPCLRFPEDAAPQNLHKKLSRTAAPASAHCMNCSILRELGQMSAGTNFS